MDWEGLAGILSSFKETQTKTTVRDHFRSPRTGLSSGAVKTLLNKR